MKSEGVIDNIVHFRIQIFFLLFLLSIYLFFNQIAYKLGLLYSEMIFVNGYVHCDPHPGNIFVRRDPSNGVEIVFLDHGLYQVWEVLSQVYQGLHSRWNTTDIMGFLIIFFEVYMVWSMFNKYYRIVVVHRSYVDKDVQSGYWL